MNEDTSIHQWSMIDWLIDGNPEWGCDVRFVLILQYKQRWGEATSPPTESIFFFTGHASWLQIQRSWIQTIDEWNRLESSSPRRKSPFRWRSRKRHCYSSSHSSLNAAPIDDDHVVVALANGKCPCEFVPTTSRHLLILCRRVVSQDQRLIPISAWGWHCWSKSIHVSTHHSISDQLYTRKQRQSTYLYLFREEMSSTIVQTESICSRILSLEL